MRNFFFCYQLQPFRTAFFFNQMLGSLTRLQALRVNSDEWQMSNGDAQYICVPF